MTSSYFSVQLVPNDEVGYSTEGRKSSLTHCQTYQTNRRVTHEVLGMISSTARRALF